MTEVCVSTTLKALVSAVPNRFSVQSSTVSFFSNDRLIFLAGRLGTNILQELVENLDDLIKKRVCQKQTSRWDGIDFEKPDPVLLQPQMATSFLLGESTIYPYSSPIHFRSDVAKPFLSTCIPCTPSSTETTSCFKLQISMWMIFCS